MKNELIQLAKEKKFSSNIISEEPWKYSVNEELRWLFWMTNLQKWLREVHSVFINIGHRPHSQKFYFTITGKYNEGEKGILYDYDHKRYKTYEASLEAGLYNALQLIK